MSPQVVSFFLSRFFSHVNKHVLQGRYDLSIPREKYSGVLASQAEAIAKEMLDQLYNAFGMMKSDLFDKDGNFVPPR